MIILITALLIQCSITQDNKNNYAVKIDSLKSVLQNNPDNAAATIELGQALQFGGKIKEAIDLLKNAKTSFQIIPE